ncbi:WD40 repeat protein [Giardia duodenalis]|uniref:WD40 repeat protein n=1 Tax=Giardia intestinalis (strain ATCC 50803 / WB clone C6) TaxID=184922 RepID=A8BC55_GIAIC|nr:WD40 repeat protein [Giardia intestinalis]KAE8301434.1 WD40 repeat protein [Giardia intestinalis]|eukprot:XP_001707833.1 Hypothetical protein GL50803_22573 [Giardia lamblia ATCC 50803]
MELRYINSLFFRRFGSHAVTITSVSPANELGILFAGMSNGCLVAWDMRYEPSPLARVVVYNAHKGAIKALCWQPYYRLLFSGGVDGLVKVWDPSFTDFLDVSGMMADHSALAQIFSSEKSNPIIERYKYTVQPLITEEETVSPSTGSIKLTRLVQSLGDFTRPIIKISYIAHHIAVLSMDGYIVVYYPDPRRDLTILRYPLFIKVASIFLGHQQLDRVKNFSTLQLGYSLQEPIHKDSVLERYNFPVSDYAYKRAMSIKLQPASSSAPLTSGAPPQASLPQKEPARLLSASFETHDTLNLRDIVECGQLDNGRSLSVTKRGTNIDVNAPLDYSVNPLLTEPVIPLSLAVDTDNTTFYVGDSNGTVHSLSVLDGKVFYKSQIKYVSNNSILDCCFVPHESSLIATGADGTVRGLIAMTGKNYFGRAGPKGVVFTRVLHCPKRKLVEYEDLMSSRPESAQFVKQIRARMRQSGPSLSTIHETDELLIDVMTQTLEEQQLRTMLQKNRNQEMREQPIAETDLTALFTGSSSKKEITAKEAYHYESHAARSMKIDEGANSDLKKKDDNIILMDASGLLLIVESTTNITLFEAMYPEIGPVPAALMAKATELGVFLTTPVVTQPRRSLNYQFYAIAKMNLSLQEEYWILRGRFAKTMAKMDQRHKLESFMTESAIKKGPARASSESRPTNSLPRAQRRAKSKSSIESMDEKVSATKVSILNCYEDMQLIDMFLLKLPPDLNPRGEVVIGIVRPVCIDFFKPVYKHAGQSRGMGHSKPIQLLSLLPAPPLPFLDPTDETKNSAEMPITDKKINSLLEGRSQEFLSTTDGNPILQRSGAACADSKSAQGMRLSNERTTMEDIANTQTESVSITAQSYYKNHAIQELSNVSESKNVDVLSSIDEPVSEDYAQAQLQQNRLRYRNNSIRSRKISNTETDFVSAIINGDISVSHSGAETIRGAYSVQDIVKTQLDSIASISTKRALSPNDPHSRMTAFAEMRHSILKSLTASRTQSPGQTISSTVVASNKPAQKNQERDDLTLQELQVSSATGAESGGSQLNTCQLTLGSSRLSNLILSKRITDSQFNRINQPEAQAKQFAPYLPPEVDIVHHIVSHHTDASGRLPLISRSGARNAAKKKLMPPFYVLSCSCDNDVYTWDARIMSRPYHHYTFSFDVLKYARILNLSQITGIVLDAASILFHKYLVDGATMATKSASVGICSDPILNRSGDKQIRKLLLSSSRLYNVEGSDSDERMIELKESNRFCQRALEIGASDQEGHGAGLSSKLKDISDRVKQEKLKKEAETRQEELFTRLSNGLSANGKGFQLSTAQKGANGVRSSNYTNYHVDDADIRVRLLKLGKSGLLDKEAVKSLINQVPTETKIYTQKTKDMSFLNFDRFYVLHPDVLNMISGAPEDNAAAEDSHLGISPYYVGKFSKDSIYNIISQSDVMPTELLCDISNSITVDKHADSQLAEAVNKSGLSLDTILSEDRTQSQTQFNRQVYFEVKKLSELPSAFRFLAVEPCNFLMIGHEDGSLTAMVTTIKQSFQGTPRKNQLAKEAASDSTILKRGNIPATNKAVSRQTTFFRVLAGHSECVSCMCYILTDQCCYVCSASIDGSILCLIHPLVGDFRLQYSVWSKFVSDLDNEALQGSKDGAEEAQDLLSEARRSPEIIEFLQGSGSFLIAGTSFGNVYFITFPLQSPLRTALFFQTKPFMQAYINSEGVTTPASTPSASIKFLDYCCDTLTIVLESGHILQFDQVSLYYKHWLYFSNTGKLAMDPSTTSHYLSRLTYDRSSHALVLSTGSSPLCNPRDAIKAPPNSPYFSSCFAAFLQHFPFKIMPQRVFSAYTQTTRKPVSADEVRELRRREVVDESEDNKIVATYVVFPIVLDTLGIGGGCTLSACDSLTDVATESTATNSKTYTSVREVIHAYDPSHDLTYKNQSSVGKVFYSNGKILERPVNKALDQGQKYYDEKLRKWRYILPEDRSPEEQPRRKPPSVLSRQSEERAVSRSKSTTPMRYINASTAAVKVSTIVQRSVSLGTSSRNKSCNRTSQITLGTKPSELSAPQNQKTKDTGSQSRGNIVSEALEPSARRVEKPDGVSESVSRSIICIGYASGLVRVYGSTGRILDEFSYDNPVSSLRAIRDDDVGRQLLLSMEAEMRIAAASTIWMGFSDGRLTMEKCSALLDYSIP